MAEDKPREGSSSDVLRGAPLFARIAASICKWSPALHMVPVTGLQGTSNVMHGTHSVDAQRHRQGKNKDSFWLPWGLWDSTELNGALLFLKAHTGLWVVYGQVWRCFLSTVVHSITFAQFRVKVIWFQTWAFYSHMLTSAQGTSQTADAMLWSIYSLRTCVRVSSLYLSSTNTHLQYCHRCPETEDRIYILCSPTEDKFNSLCSLWSLNTTVALHQSRTRKSVSYLKSLRFHQKEKDHSATESNLTAQVRQKRSLFGSLQSDCFSPVTL